MPSLFVIRFPEYLEGVICISIALIGIFFSSVTFPVMGKIWVYAWNEKNIKSIRNENFISKHIA
jgi:hypothetical protein